MAYSYVNYIGDGTQANWTFRFPYLDPENVYATVNGQRWYFDFAAPNTAQLIPTPPSGSSIQIFRNTVSSATPHQWTDGSVLRDKDLNRLALFCLYCAQEQADKGGINGGGIGDGLGLSIPQILEGLTGKIELDQFALDLVKTVGLITADSSVPGSVTAKVLAETEARSAAMASETEIRETAEESLAARASALEASMGGFDGAALHAQIVDEASARATADDANANATSTLQAAVTGINTGLATVQTQANASTTALGTVNANYTLKTQALANGKLAVAGIGLNATATGTTAQSEIIFAADKFQFISTIGGLAETPQGLLQLGVVGGVNTLVLAPTTIGDQTIAARMVVDGSLTASKIDTRGLSIKDAAGNIILSAGVPLDSSRIAAPANWLNSNVTLGGLGYTGATNATANQSDATTNGAISAAQGTANTANSNASTALSTANGAAAAAADRLSKATNSVLSATISVNAVAGAGFVAGTMTWNASGVRTGGYGVAMTPGGITAYSPSGVNTFSLDAVTGNAFFGGTLLLGTSTKGATTLTSSSFANQPGAGTSISLAPFNSIGYAAHGYDVMVTFNVTVAVQTNTGTALRIIMTPYMDSTDFPTLIGCAAPEFEVALVNSNPISFAVGSGATGYNWGTTASFNFSVILPASAVSAASHQFKVGLLATFPNGTGFNTITGTSIYAKCTASLREFLA